MSLNAWTECTVAEIAAPSKNALVGGPFGSNLVQRDYTPAGVPVIRGQNMGSGRWVSGRFAFVSEEKAQLLSPNTTRPGDLVFTQRGTIGQVALVPPEPFDRYIISQSQMKLTVDSTKADSMFLYYVFTTEEQKDYIHRNAIQTGVPHTNLEHLRTTPLRLPPLREQQAIAQVLGTLDDKIEFNRRMNETLEAMAQALFKSWFVDAAETELSRGWRIVPLPKVIEVNPPRSLKKGELARYVDMQNMPTRGHRPLGWIEREFGTGMRFINGDTLLARITPCLENGKTAFVDWLDDGRVGWGSTEYIVLRPKPPLPPEFGYYLARSEELRFVAIQNMTGSSGRQRVPAECLEKFEIALPPEPLAKRFGEIARHHMALCRANDEQSRTIAALRDALLPKLLSGELKTEYLSPIGVE